jgi:hypothetical protein
MSVPFNPLDLENLGDSIARAMATQIPFKIDQLPEFQGAGIYALYYSGNHPAYESLVAANVDREEPHPIYVGRAAAKGARKGLAPATEGTALRLRLQQHARSIMEASNLDPADFEARWLVLEHVWVSLGEAVLIRRHSPVWNAILDGFGNHDPGSGRHAGARSRWDVLHPGRSWVDRLGSADATESALIAEVQEYLRQRN